MLKAQKNKKRKYNEYIQEKIRPHYKFSKGGPETLVDIYPNINLNDPTDTHMYYAIRSTADFISLTKRLGENGIVVMRELAADLIKNQMYPLRFECECTFTVDKQKKFQLLVSGWLKYCAYAYIENESNNQRKVLTYSSGNGNPHVHNDYTLKTADVREFFVHGINNCIITFMDAKKKKIISTKLKVNFISNTRAPQPRITYLDTDKTDLQPTDINSNLQMLANVVYMQDMQDNNLDILAQAAHLVEKKN